MAAFRFVGVVRLTLDVGAVRLHIPGAAPVSQLDVEKAAQVPLEHEALDRHKNLDAALQIPLHGVGRADEILLLAPVAEIIESCMFQKAADNADNTDVV